ncbi:uncharacterized protein LOC113208255 [Frankliniella occidentalis]|uniref:Uncharacterized protein LOC113208255 n=1 Tax=Frankliniella occidentalis TaxID=133901 RepID=A0A6J1SJ38_FRAOC|nr:uncharacterized protein LOC113208255 [Frankliniella occidentalis]
MKFILGLCFLLGIACDFSTAAALEGKNRGMTAIPRSTKSVRANGDSSQTSNMTVAFVPLISIIANLLPRFFGRYSPVTPASSVQQARAFLEVKKEKVECNEPWHVGKRWTNHLNRSVYYQCYHSKNCSSIYEESCFVVKMQRCKFPKEFHTEKKLCLVDVNMKTVKHAESNFDFYDNYT